MGVGTGVGFGVGLEVGGSVGAFVGLLVEASQELDVQFTRASKLQPPKQHTPASSSSIEQRRIPALEQRASASKKVDTVLQIPFGLRLHLTPSLVSSQQLTALGLGIVVAQHSLTCTSPSLMHPSDPR